tara:strand:+ start:330 stop:656 length:327 start_codon:yes stop_codon:yes gene_type:complete
MIMQALYALAPTAEWSLQDDNLSTLVWLSEDITQPSNEDIEAKVTELTNAEPLRLLRTERNRLLAETDYWTLSDTADITDSQTAYRTALRDITNSATSLDDVTWPEKP